ncbi:MAG TPA: [acyl-carrier-protein] S-malonyltransferase [Saprospiraceae bacterium]|nr:[acyl-carrier-protein] S-malonyltransferase [Saprospiraceae bacterium]HHH53125.1 [acyl-carrier-protein] S-malonyltransferase [Bacteroidota bacterium]
MTAYLFPGQASQFEGMGKDMYDSSDIAKEYFEKANEILGFRISDIMFEGTMEDLKQTKVTQPAVFLHSYISYVLNGGKYNPDAVAGHSLGEFTALTASGVLDFEDGLELVKIRANAMQKACEVAESTMAAVLGLDDNIVEEVCATIDDIVIPANYNCPGQLVISGSKTGIAKAIEKLKENGAKRAIELQVGGAFHSPFMKPAEEELAEAIREAKFNKVQVPVYQNVNAKKETDSDVIKENLIKQLTSPVRWTQTMRNMIDDGIDHFVEVGGNGKTLVNFVRRIDRSLKTEAI